MSPTERSMKNNPSCCFLVIPKHLHNGQSYKEILGSGRTIRAPTSTIRGDDDRIEVRTDLHMNSWAVSYGDCDGGSTCAWEPVGRPGSFPVVAAIIRVVPVPLDLSIHEKRRERHTRASQRCIRFPPAWLWSRHSRGSGWPCRGRWLCSRRLPWSCSRSCNSN